MKLLFVYVFCIFQLLSGATASATATFWRWDEALRPARFSALPAPSTEDADPIVAELATTYPVIVFAEEHYQRPIQLAQALLLQKILQSNSHRVGLAWEFLSTQSDALISELWRQVLDRQLLVEDFLRQTQKSETALLYTPIFEVARDHQIPVFPVNLTREQKAPVLRSGISALDPSLLPQGFSLELAGFGPRYWNRFSEAMGHGGHASPEQVRRYYEAQCLTDDYVAVQVAEKMREQVDQVILVMGAFHSDFGDGVLARLKARTGRSSLAVRFIGSALPEEWVSPSYGPLAPFLISAQD